MRLLLLFTLISCAAFSQESISIITPQQNLENPISSLAIEDAKKLIAQACNCEVVINDKKSEISIVLPEIDTSLASKPTKFEEEANYPYLRFPEHWYKWKGIKAGEGYSLKLETPTFVGISNGIYGLLQEQLGFKFYHPRESIIPQWEKWPLDEALDWSAKPRFDKAGFHIHSQHPLELTESLLYHDYPNAIENVKEYIDWLARNGQNYFEFNLLESIDLKEWPAFAKQMTDYCHERGIIAGVDVSLHMIQQKAFQLYKNWPASWRSKEKQIERSLEKLFVADWDVFNVEFSSTEFTSGNVKKKKLLQLHLGRLLRDKYGSKLAGRKHVVKESAEVGGKKKKHYGMTEEEAALDAERCILVHTVMFYTISEEKAPVYRNENLRHMLDILMKEKQVRETWYYPESAYWVTFDSSIPLLLTPYLSARLDDILTMDSLGIPGHITFSSGWEWGYWLFDWSIARWSWEHSYNGAPQKVYPTQFVDDIFGKQEGISTFFKDNVKLQEEYLKDKELMRYMTAMTATDELPGPANIEFHPRPKHSYKWLAKKSDVETLEEVRKTDLELLEEFSAKTKEQVEALDKSAKNLTDPQKKILQELRDGVEITGLRAKHRNYTLNYILTKRENKLKKEDVPLQPIMEKAKETRLNALGIVARQEKKYRYPIDRLTTVHKEPTSYHFGYLYPVHDLHFWKREESQYKKNKFGAFYKSIWNVWRIMGVIN